MMDRRSEKCDEYWTESAHKGFDFDDDPWPSQAGQLKFTSELKTDETLKQFDLLRYDGLNEVADKVQKPTEMPELSNFRKPSLETQKSRSLVISAIQCDPFVLNIKSPEQSVKLTPKRIVRNMILGLEYSFEHLKGKDEKLELLDAAVKSHDGNAIIAAVLFLRQTLKKTIFQREIIKFQEAVNMYLFFLEEDHELDELTNMLLLLGRDEEAAMLKYRTAMVIENMDSKAKWLENCLGTHFQVDSVGYFLASAVSQHYLNITIQNNLIKFHKEQASAESTESLEVMFEKVTGRSFGNDSSVLDTVLFSSMYYYHLSDTHRFSPPSLKKLYNLGNNQFTWTVTRALAACKKYSEIEDLLRSKNWLGGKKIKCCIGFPNLLTVLSKFNAPVEVLENYVNYVDDYDERLTLAKKYGCHYAAIKMLKLLKDRQGLMQYVATLNPQTVSYCYAIEALNCQNIKWKN